MHEQEKKRCYGQRVRDVERAAFTPLIFSSTGGMASECTTFFKRLSSMLAEKRKMRHQHVITWLRCKTSFTLLRPSIMTIKGARSAKRSCLIPLTSLMQHWSNTFTKTYLYCLNSCCSHQVLTEWLLLRPDGGHCGSRVCSQHAPRCTEQPRALPSPSCV